MSRKEKLQDQLFILTGVQIDITVIGRDEFSFSWDGFDEEPFVKIKNFFRDSPLEISTDGDLYDEECEFCCCYGKLK